MLCTGCEWKLKPNGDGDGNAHVEVQRYDRLESRYLTTGDFSALQQMNIEYPVETRTLIEKVLQIGEVNDPEISNKFLRFYQDSTLQMLIADTEAEYANMDDLNSQLQRSFDNLRSFLPDFPVPQVYAQIGALDHSIIVGDRQIGICLDKYMGENYPLYSKYYDYSQRVTMTRRYIVPDCLTFYLLSLYPMEQYDSRSQFEKDMHMGKVMWVVNKALGSNFFKTEYVARVDKYMRQHQHIPVAQLLISDDYSQMV
jgi:hypothetical protein